MPDENPTWHEDIDFSTIGNTPFAASRRRERRRSLSHQFADPASMNLFSTFKRASSLAFCVALAACATTEQAPSAPVRTRAPQGYEKTITNYLAFRIRGPQSDAEINIGTPEPGGCALDSFVNSSRGWVVPVVYATRTGVPSGKETINIVTRQYYFWFMGETIAGLTSRVDLCPGAALTEFPQPPSAPDVALAAAAASSPAKADASGREGAAAQKSGSANKAKKTGPSSTGAGKPVKKPEPSPGKV
jgi:hypothetical protein